MIVGTDDGKLQLNIYDSFLIGTFPSPVSESLNTPPYMISHAAHPRLSTHALVFAHTQTEPEYLHLVPMDLPFISSSPINLCLLASKLTTLQKLLRYIKQTQLHMQVEWKNTRELPSRFLRSVQGDLEELPSGPRSIVPALYHTVVTGHAYGPVREWLIDSLAERVGVFPASNVRELKHVLISILPTGSQAMGQSRRLRSRKSPQPSPREFPSGIRALYHYSQPSTWFGSILRRQRRHWILGYSNQQTSRHYRLSGSSWPQDSIQCHGRTGAFQRVFYMVAISD